MKHTIAACLLLAGCSGPAASSLAPADRSSLEARLEKAEELGTLVYTGQVAPRDGGRPLFVYQRIVREVGGDQLSSHVTYRSGDAEITVLHEATTNDAGQLTRFDEWHGQTGLVGSLTVDADHTATFDVSVAGSRRTKTETGSDPVATGPSLFAFVLDRWDILLDGDTVPVRFAVLEDLRTYRFALRVEEATDERVLFEMRATKPLVRAFVPKAVITFDAETRDPVRYEGLVPPHEETDRGLRTLDARVDYELAGDSYR